MNQLQIHQLPQDKQVLQLNSSKYELRIFLQGKVQWIMIKRNGILFQISIAILKAFNLKSLDAYDRSGFFLKVLVNLFHCCFELMILLSVIKKNVASKLHHLTLAQLCSRVFIPEYIKSYA